VGIWVRHLITVYEPVARYRTLLFAAFWVVYFGAIATGGLNTVMWSLFTTLQTSPLGWPGHLLLVRVPGIDPSTVGIVGAVAGSALLVGVAFVAGVPSAQRHWFADPARTDDEEIDEETSSDRLAGLLPGTVSRPVRTVAVTAIRRTKRAPIRLAYAGYPLLGALGFIQQIIESGTVPSFMAVMFCLYVVWAAGVLFTLTRSATSDRPCPPLSRRRSPAGRRSAAACSPVRSSPFRSPSSCRSHSDSSARSRSSTPPR